MPYVRAAVVLTGLDAWLVRKVLADRLADPQRPVADGLRDHLERVEADLGRAEDAWRDQLDGRDEPAAPGNPPAAPGKSAGQPDESGARSTAMTTREYALKHDLPQRTVRDRCVRDVLPAVKVGGAWIVYEPTEDAS